MEETSGVALGSPLAELVASVREEVTQRKGAVATARAVARHLEESLDEPDLLDPRYEEPDEDEYRQHVLHVEPDGSFSVVALVWLPDQETPIHDHVSWCVPGVYRGREEETRFRLVGSDREAAAGGDGGQTAYLVQAATGTNEAGDVVALTPPGDIHRVRNPGPGKAVSLHVYGADISSLGSSIRRTYDLPVKRPG